jgi:hypothetical protein
MMSAMVTPSAVTGASCRNGSPARRAGERARGSPCPWPCADLFEDRGSRGREGGWPVHGRDGSAGDRVGVVQVLPQGGCFRWPAS